ncbi:MAG: hypothetical protein Q9M94_06050 [Candidatus Gracilibacteria bacterium]|nr:hypothetical protein [Candidatus Gracilibacteria bacterium]MDQ7023177.1 hypothetical protein [Candidatus Gracilibacteria bacterium]
MTTYQLRLDSELKENFLRISKEKGLDGSMVIRYFMQKFTDKPEIVKFEIDNDFMDGIMGDKEVVLKLNKISDKLDKIGF